MILDLVAAGKRVGVTANGHKVIGKLLDDVWDAAAQRRSASSSRPIRLGQKPGDGEPTCHHATSSRRTRTFVPRSTSAPWTSSAGRRGCGHARSLADQVDVLFIDEAGQFSLANAVAVSPAAASLVLLGDPQQLDQPTQGTHPAWRRVGARSPICSMGRR